MSLYDAMAPKDRLPNITVTLPGRMPEWRAQIERRAAEAHAEIRAEGIAARRSIGQFLRYRREGGR